jgi:hypothetical protein
MTKPINTTNVTYVFSHTTLLEALKEWELEQVKHYPLQEERIQIATVAMQYFLRSQQVRDHKMIVSGEPNDIEIVMPVSIFDQEPKKDSGTKESK